MLCRCSISYRSGRHKSVPYTRTDDRYDCSRRDGNRRPCSSCAIFPHLYLDSDLILVPHPIVQHGHDGEATYVIPRPSPPGMVLVGGTFQPNNWNTSVDMATAEGIFNRAKALVPALEAPEARILAHNVGLRPAREGGPRVEVEVVEFPMKGLLRPKPDGLRDMAEKKLAVVHAYGFGCVIPLPWMSRSLIRMPHGSRPAGYQQSWGGAEEAVRLIKESLGMNA